MEQLKNRTKPRAAQPLPRPKSVLVPTEYDEQVAIFDYARRKERHDPRWRLLFSTLNGVRLPIGLAKKCKAAGNRAGVPDLILPVHNGIFAMLFIELKRRKGGVVSEEQQAWHEALTASGHYRVIVCKGAADAIHEIEAYLA